ncbi:ARM repeat-containing protein [Trichoderma citrinoviride]|uniref:ARM repeat-containing protein n=1 Tax=Trichoderma citrinoviride TaxID=58853 RepID=A0A2T4AXK7_9HYPO|nr:ARM repeat-containing protein [Trichoderma citrinoviride]PTB61824.1 ARM repeat-containing protein [Trichoderma citrinoviride]
MQDELLPSEVEQVESLILSLYEPASPSQIAKTQSTLSRLQSSPQAWTLAHHLLGRPDDKVKFFGALTIIVKLNTENASLSDADAIELLVSLLEWYMGSLQQKTGLLVVRKLSSALSTYFVYFHRLCSRIIFHLLVCLASNRAWQPGAIDDSVDFNAISERLSGVHLHAAILVISNILEDVTRIDLNAASNVGLYDSVLANTSDSVTLIAMCMSRDDASPEVKQDALRCLQSWVTFAQKTSARNSYIADSLRPLIGGSINALMVEELYNAAAELLIDVLFNWPSLLTEQHYMMLSNLFDTPWFQNRYDLLVQGDVDFESTQLGYVLLAYGEAKMQALIQDENDQNRSILSRLCGLLAADGYPVAENKIFVPAIEFWSTFTESVSDMDVESALTIQFIFEATSHAWKKIIYPPAEEFHSWDSGDRIGFNDARKDVVDFLQAVYVLIGPKLVETFSSLILTTLSNSAWLELEAAIFCLGGLADCSREDARCDGSLAAVFSSPLFSVLQSGQEHVPARVRQTCLTLIEQYTEYFERNTHLLPTALGLLFNEVPDHSMAIPASKSIHRLCSSCRSHLYPEMDNLLAEYRKLVATATLDCISREKIIGALAAIAQAIPGDDERYDACSGLLAFIQDDVRKSLELANVPNDGVLPQQMDNPCPDITPEEHAGLHVGLRALRCLASMGKGLQSPPDLAIDLEASSPPKEQTPKLVELQKQVIGIIIEIQNAFNGSSEVTELICSVLRSGFSESEPGPFVLTPEDIVGFLVGHSKDTPRIGVIVSMACSFVSSLSPHRLGQYRKILSDVLGWLIGLLKQLPEPAADPELVQNGIDLVSRLVTRSPGTFIGLEPSDAIEFFFLFTLQVLDGKEPLPKAAAAEFWTAFVGTRADEPELQETFKRAMDMLGPLLAQSLARNIGGNALRSELDRLCEPLRKLVSRYPMAKEWLQSGLDHPSFPSQKVDAEQKSLFVKKIISLRGSRTTNQVVREFWLSARGANFAYAS